MRLIIVIFFLCWYFSAGAQCSKRIELEFIKKIESAGDSCALNLTDGGSRGLYQINPVGLRDYNKYHKKKYTLEDLWNAEINKRIAVWMFEKRIPQLLRAYGFRNTINNQIICYNAGIDFLVSKRKIPRGTIKYIEKYRKMCEKNSKKNLHLI